jgi:preprotein translocase SecE subunit
MALGLYKPGQGYWMRVLTAAVVGTLFLAMAMWMAGQAKRVVSTLPVRTYSIDVRGTTTGEPPAPGTRLTLLAEGSGTAAAPKIGTAIVEAYDAENRLIVVRNAEITNPNYEIGRTRLVQVDGASGPVFSADVPDNPRGRPPVEPVLVEGIAASLVLIFGAIITYWICAIRPKTVDFLINTDMEMKKVNWSTRRDIVGSTWVVIGSSFLIAAFIFAADAIMKNLFQIIGVLKT